MKPSSPPAAGGKTPGAPVAEPTEPAREGAAFSPHAFGKYYLIDRIAMGGMAEIFKAKTFGEGGFEKLLVIKRILAHLSDNPQFVRMFMDEAKVSALLQHANVVQIHDFGKIRDNYFLAMECVEGKDVKLILRKLAERRKLLPMEFAVYIAMEAAKGLDYAHKLTNRGQSLEIVHRDVSPSNILVSYGGEVKVADFGIVKAANCAEDSDAGTLKGKFEYMSPEQASGKEIDRRSDVFSLGIILHEMLTGRRLFKTDSEIKTLERIKAADVDPPSATNPQVPVRLDDIVMRALARDPDDRYQSAHDFHTDLIEYLYPASPHLTMQSFAHFMQELFAKEIAEERQHLDEGTRIAMAMHEAAPQVELEEDWEENGRSEPSIRVRQSSGVPMAVGAAAIAILVVTAVAVAFLWPAAHGTDTPPVAAAAPTTGSVEVRVEPVSAKVFFDDAAVGEGQRVLVQDLSAGVERKVRIEAAGYTPVNDTFTVTGGERVRLAYTLAPVAPAPRATPSAPTPAAAPVVRAASAQAAAPASTTSMTTFTSTPPGASVEIDNRFIGKTPVTWTGSANARVTVEYNLDGYDPVKFSTTFPGPDGKQTVDRSLSAHVAGDGKVSVNVSGGWADVYVDGKKIGATPLTRPLPAGPHEIRVKNDDRGFDATQKVTIKAGETTSVPFSIN